MKLNHKELLSNFIFFAVDINIDSCKFASQYFKFYNNSVEVINGDLLQSLGGLLSKIDILIFNPVI